MWKSEQPPDAVLSPTWSLTDVCGSSVIVPAAHSKRTTTVLAIAAVIQKLAPDWKRPLGRPSHTWLLAVEADVSQLDILASHLPGGRLLFVTTGGAWWTKQSNGVYYERRSPTQSSSDYPS